MNRFIKNKALWLFAAVAVATTSTLGAFGQTKPLLQDIPIVQPSVKPTATPLVTKTSSALPVARRTSIPALMNVDIPGYSGILVESPEGNIVLETNSALTFNPASNVKIATAYAVLKSYKPDARFQTAIYYDGEINKSTATLEGDLYVTGIDPSFNLEHGVALANALNTLGIRTVTGDLIVTYNFVMNYSASAERAAALLNSTLDASKRSAATSRAWQNYLVNSRQLGQITWVPSVSIAGATFVQSIPSTAKLLFSHESAPMREIIKATLCYSNNYLSERLADMVGGSYRVAQIVQQNVGISPMEFYLASGSGLGQSRVSPRAMMKVLSALQKDLAKYKMTFADIMPVAGLDDGTLEGRFDDVFARGSVVGKTGSMNNTDGGVSALAGEMNTRKGKFLFVIFNQRGSVARFRNFQNSLVTLMQSELGGAVPIAYNAVSLDVRLANTRITYADTRARKTEE